ncbi:hypothetical protein SAMN04488056_12333 [Cohaesibacter marisflavi]|uniref:Uncharacterized protein n=1 Tax=Cohaesibacter marisflavi TaxID=655353 RepID=A0A1I5MUH7_9HYPH|nr:hypothetical protein [Cohaesibacter marisflavi]SFP13169.1 hypothetical protein SAMN04488056_12333 [Cohaesibacter marisflavi]
MIDALAVIKQACDIAGITAPENLTDELYKGAVAQDLYNHQARAALAVHPFSFAQDLVQLNRLLDAPIAGYSYCHQIPTEDLIIGVDRLTDQPTDPDYSFADFVKYGLKIHSNALDLYAVIRKQVGPHLWNPIFVNVVATGLASVLVLAIASDDKLSAQLKKDAYGDAREEMRGGLMRAAINSDQFTKPNKRMRMGNNPLTAAWLS